MPKKPIDYANSSIYKLCCRDTDITDCYVGSTTNFRTRKNQHKCVCYKQEYKTYNRKVYQFIREHGGWENWDMVLIEKVNVNDGNELHKEERKWIEQLNATLNQVIPTRTIKEYQKEYLENNKEKIRGKRKIYRENNKEKIKEYYEDNKDKLKEKKKIYREINKDKIKEYRENNKEYYKEYQEINKVKIKEQRNKKMECPICNSIVNKGNLPRHQKTMKCINASK